MLYMQTSKISCNINNTMQWLPNLSIMEKLYEEVRKNCSNNVSFKK